MTEVYEKPVVVEEAVLSSEIPAWGMHYPASCGCSIFDVDTNSPTFEEDVLSGIDDYFNGN